MNDPPENNAREELLPEIPQNVPPPPPTLPPPVYHPTDAWYKDLEACQMFDG
jgi:hypothetical protein